MRKILLILISLFMVSINAKENLSEDLKKFVENPQLGTRCQNLINKRKSQMELVQRAVSLEDKTKKMLQKVPEKKLSLKEKLENLQQEFFKEKTLLELKVKILEEEIVLKGCPGIKL